MVPELVFEDGREDPRETIVSGITRASGTRKADTPWRTRPATSFS
jgi:hypothetical protein